MNKMNQLQKQILVWVIFVLAVVALIIFCNREDIKASLQKFIAEVRLEYTYGIDVEIESIYEDGAFAEEYSDETHKFDKDDKFYRVVAKEEDTGMKLYAYTDDFYKPICSNYPEIKYAEKLCKEFDECIQEYISKDEYVFRVVFLNTMYFEECSYEEFKGDFGLRHVGDASLFVDKNVSNEQILKVTSLEMERNIALNLECYMVLLDDRKYWLPLSENYSYRWDERGYFSKLISNSVNCSGFVDEFRYFIDYGTENEVEVLKRDFEDRFDEVMFSDHDMFVVVYNADVNSILEQYSGHTISVTKSGYLLRTSEINEDNILDGNKLKF